MRPEQVLRAFDRLRPHAATEERLMTVEVRIPTILRTFTGGAKAVEGSGETLSAVIDDIDARNPGLKERLVESDGLRRFVNVYVNDEDVRFSGGLSAPTSDGDVVVVLPAVAGGAQRFSGGLRGVVSPRDA
jgi:sulfur-carrier protein